MENEKRKPKDIMSDIASVRNQSNDAYGYYKSLKTAEAGLRLELEEIMRDMGMRELKTEDGLLTAYFSKHESLKVFDPDQVMTWLEENDFVGYDYFKPDNVALKSVYKSYLKQKNLEMPGVELTEKVSLGLKENKPKKTKISSLAEEAIE